MKAKRVAHLLLVEDDPGDRLLTQKSLAQTNLDLNLHLAEDGEEALSYLRKEGRFAGEPSPDLILLDLNLPKINGREVLAQIRKDPKLTHLPVVILTTSRAEADVLDSYRLHANAFITKPVDLNQFRDALSSLQSFWFGVVTLPKSVN